MNANAQALCLEPEPKNAARDISPIAAARTALDQAERDLAAVDLRVAGYQQELEDREVEQLAHRSALIAAVSSGQRVPKPPKIKASDAEVALPILRAERVKLAERVAECSGLLRRACVQEVERRYLAGCAEYAKAASALIAAWRTLIGTKALLDNSGARIGIAPVPPMLYESFAIPALATMRPICENHAMHFIAGHSLAQGELHRAERAARVECERDIDMKLPW